MILYYFTILLDASMSREATNMGGSLEDQVLLTRLTRVTIFGILLFLVMLPLSYLRGIAILSQDPALYTLNLVLPLILLTAAIIYLLYKSVSNALTLRRLLHESQALYDQGSGSLQQLDNLRYHLKKVVTFLSRVGFIFGLNIIATLAFVILTLPYALAHHWWGPYVKWRYWSINRLCFQINIYHFMHIILYDELPTWKSCWNLLYTCKCPCRSRAPRPRPSVISMGHQLRPSLVTEVPMWR